MTDRPVPRSCRKFLLLECCLCGDVIIVLARSRKVIPLSFSRVGGNALSKHITLGDMVRTCKIPWFDLKDCDRMSLSNQSFTLTLLSTLHVGVKMQRFPCIATLIAVLRAFEWISEHEAPSLEFRVPSRTCCVDTKFRQ